MNLTIRQLIQELRAASEVVGADAEVEGVESVMTTMRSVRLDGDFDEEIRDLRMANERLTQDNDDLDDEISDTADKIREALVILRSDEEFSRAAVIRVLE